MLSRINGLQLQVIKDGVKVLVKKVDFVEVAFSFVGITGK